MWAIQRGMVCGRAAVDAAAVSHGTLGQTSIGGSTDASSTKLVAGKITTVGAITAVSISAYISEGTPGRTLSCAIYTDSGGPGTKIAEQTATVSSDPVVGTPGWITINIAASLSAATSYWIAVWSSGGGVTWYFDVTTPFAVFDNGQTYNTWPSPWSTFSSYGALVSIYLSY